MIRYHGNIRSPIYVLESLETQELLVNLDIPPPFHNLNNYTITSSILTFRHVVLPGTPEHGTPEHQNITEHSGTPEKSGTSPKNPEQPKRNPENLPKNRHVVLPGTPEHGTPEHGTPEHRNITEHSGTPEKPGTLPKNPEQPKKTRNTSQKTRNTFFLPASYSLSSLAGTNSKYKQNKDIFSFSFEALKCKILINIRNSVLFQLLVSAISTLLLTEPIQWMLEPLHHRCSALYLLSWEAN